MLKRFKAFLWRSKVTKYPYRFLWYWKNNSLRTAVTHTFAYLFITKPSKKLDSTSSRDDISFDFKRSFQLPDILLENQIKKSYEIVNCAFRKHEPKKGLTGGPNGVLATVRSFFGSSYRGLPMRYIFHSHDFPYPEHLKRAVSGLSNMIRINFYAAYYFQYCVSCWERQNEKNDLLFICHELGSAYGAYLRNCKYILIYHAQGSTVNERESFGEVLSERDKKVATRLEEVVFYNAEYVYFPSLGAKQSFIETTEIDCSKVRFAEEPLYNTIQDEPPELDVKRLLEKLNLLRINRDEYDVMLSVGDFSINKGLERVPLVLNEYCKRTKRKVYWIGIGSKHNAGIYEKLLEEKGSWLFESTLIGERTDHDTLLALMRYADYYIMLQRHSIFDLSTLEAMRVGKALILTPVGGNIEVNKEDNVIFVDLDHIDTTVNKLIQADKTRLGEKNKHVFEKYFSSRCFFDAYSRMLDKILTDVGVLPTQTSTINYNNFIRFKGKYKGRVIICGSGSSLESYKPDNEAYHIALNRALFYEPIHFDAVFMQDHPQNQPYKLEDYNRYPCMKFYGIINNPKTHDIGFTKTEFEADGINGEIVYYELAPTWFDQRIDQLSFDISTSYFVDAQSVLFSALQFVVFAGFSEIVLYGIDFSDLNFGSNINPNKYNENVIPNLIYFKKVIKEKLPDIQFRFGSTTNVGLKKEFDQIDGANLTSSK